MKKTLGIVLAVLLTLMLSVPAFAAETFKQESGTTTQGVSAEYKEENATSAGNIYYVNVTWDSQSTGLVYSAGNRTYTWNGEDMKYVSADAVVGDGWTGSATVKVTVENRSNAGITATGTATNNYNLQITAEESEVTLGSAAVKDGVHLEITSPEQGNAQTGTIEFKIDSNNSKKPWNGQDSIGLLTVTISPQS